jgi:hypothetical protein
MDMKPQRLRLWRNDRGDGHSHSPRFFVVPSDGYLHLFEIENGRTDGHDGPGKTEQTHQRLASVIPGDREGAPERRKPEKPEPDPRERPSRRTRIEIAQGGTDRDGEEADGGKRFPGVQAGFVAFPEPEGEEHGPGDERADQGQGHGPLFGLRLDRGRRPVLALLGPGRQGQGAEGETGYKNDAHHLCQGRVSFHGPSLSLFRPGVVKSRPVDYSRR